MVQALAFSPTNQLWTALAIDAVVIAIIAGMVLRLKWKQARTASSTQKD